MSVVLLVIDIHDYLYSLAHMHGIINCVEDPNF